MARITAREAKALQPFDRVEVALDLIDNHISQAAKDDKDSIIIRENILPDVKAWYAATQTLNQSPGLTNDVVLNLLQRGFQVQSQYSPSDGPNRPEWWGVKISW